VPEGLAVLRDVRPSDGHGDHSSAWIKDAIARYYLPSEEEKSYRHPAARTLRQLDDRFSFLKNDTVVLDLGSFPGGWSEVAVERTHPSSSSSLVIGVDSVRMDPLKDHTFIHGDLGKKATVEEIVKALNGRRADVVLADVMAPTIGLKMEDHLNSMQGCLFAGRVMERTLAPGGWFICKLLWGVEQQHWRLYLESRFDTVRTIKPPASRPVHREMFMICRGYQGRHSIREEATQSLPRHEGIDLWSGNTARGQYTDE